MKDLRTRAIVLKRTDYAEADRILQILTPQGKFSVIARGVRREKSRLAGGIELFSVSDVNLHFGRKNASAAAASGEALGILTGARLLTHFDAFVKDIELLEMGGRMMREASRKAEQVESEGFFEILEQVFASMQRCASVSESELPVRWKDVLWAWWGINLARVAGEEANLRFDTQGEKLLAEGRYFWDEESMAFAPSAKGRIGAEHIKFLRVMASSPASLALRVKNADELIGEALFVARCLH